MSLARFRATYTDGETAHLHEVEVRLAPYQITLHSVPDGKTIAVWPVSTLKVDRSMMPHVRITSRVGGEAALGIDDRDFYQAFTQITKGRTRREWHRGARLALAVAVVIAIGAGVWNSLNPISGLIARRIPFSWEQKVANNFKENFVTKTCDDPELTPVLEQLKRNVLGSTKLPMDFEIIVAKDSTVNAFALPGGVIVLNRGLIREAVSPDEIAGVLAHEMQHVTQRHVTAHLVRGAILSAIWSVTVGDFSGVLVVDPHTLYQIATLKFDRDTESEADRLAIKMLDDAKITREGFIMFFQRLAKERSNIPDILSTHPASHDRVAMLRQGEGPTDTRPALLHKDWKILQSACADSDDASDTEED